MEKLKKPKKRSRRPYILAGLALIILFFVFRSYTRAPELPKVSTALVKKASIVEKVTASGKIQPEAEVKISPDVSGEITDVFVAEGDSVVKGQLLLRIRPDNFQEVVESARASLNSIRSNYSQSQSVLQQRQAELVRSEQDFLRNKKLFEQKVISEADFIAARTNYEVAKKAVEAAQGNLEAARYNIQSSQANLNQSVDNLSRTEIYAPVSGTISKLSVEKGEKVVGTAQMAGTEMMIIANLDNMEVQVDVNENDIVKVKEGQEVVVDVDAYTTSGRKFKGIVTEIANTANATVSADAVTEFQVKIRILPESYQDLKAKNRAPFRPGMTASVEIITNRKNDILTVPIAAVTTRTEAQLMQKPATPNGKTQSANSEAKGNEDTKEVVFVYNSTTKEVEARQVSTGISDFENIEIRTGLKNGEKIISGPFNLVAKQLMPGQKVEESEESRGNKP